MRSVICIICEYIMTHSNGTFLIRIVCEVKLGGRGEEAENEEFEAIDSLHSYAKWRRFISSFGFIHEFPPFICEMEAIDFLHSYELYVE